MSLRHTSWLLPALVSCWPLAVSAQLQLVPDAQPPRVFAGEARTVTVVWHNAGDKAAAADISARMLQTSSATAVQLYERPWKRLQVLPGQTVVESVLINFPAVRTETRFFVQWLADTNRIIGRTEIFVYPTNLLAGLKPLAADDSLGVFDPLNQLKPLLKNLKLKITDLENIDLENFSGRLAIIGPFQSKTQMRAGLAKQVQALVKKGAAIVWLQPPTEKCAIPVPSFYSVPAGQVAVVMVQPDMVADLADNPQSQLNLVYFCRLAFNPQPFVLPDPSPQP